MRNGPGPGVLWTLFRYEIRMLLRDTRTVLIALVAPMVIFPLYIVLMNYVESREQEALQEETYTYAVSGSRPEWARGLVESAIRLEASDPDTSRAPVQFEEKAPGNPEGALTSGEIHLVVQGLSAVEWDSIRREERLEEERAEDREREGGGEGEEEEGEGEGSSPEAEGERVVAPPVPALRILFRGESDFSREARVRLRDRILEVRAVRRDSVYRNAGFPVAMEEVAPLESESVATAAKEAGAFLGVALMPFLVLLMLSGGSIVAVDAISGEKERGTLETLLTTAADRTDIVRAKLLAVIAVGLAVAVINVLNLIVYLVVGLLDLPTSLAVELGAPEVVLLLLLFVPVAVLIAAALLLLSGASKSFKDYQVRFLPVLVAIGFPSMAAVLPGIDLRSAVAFVPMAGIAVAVREVLVGEVDLLFILIAFLSTGGMALWLTRLTQDTLSNEKLISGSDLDQADLVGGAALFPRHVFRWFLTLWVIFFLVSLWWGEELGVRGQVLVNLVLIFFGGSLVMIRHYRLDPREAFGLRRPHPAAWLAVVLGAPAALMVGVGLAELVNTWVFPVPEQVLESFARELVEPELAIWQLVFFLTIMPGVFEELAFRGVLLHGMRKRIKRRWVLALLNGVIFGIFHVSLFRIAPTAWLGFVLTWVVLLGGSVYPVMLWHALNNGIAVVPAAAGWIPEDFTPESWWAFPALLLLALSFWILWKTGPRVEESPP